MVKILVRCNWVSGYSLIFADDFLLFLGRTMSKVDSTPFSTFDNDECPRFTPFDERSQQLSEKSQNNARKKLGFESLFDTSDPCVDEVDDVIGLCSGQFLTQKPLIDR